MLPAQSLAEHLAAAVEQRLLRLSAVPLVPQLPHKPTRPGGYWFYQNACYQQRADGAYVVVSPEYCATPPAAPVAVAPPPPGHARDARKPRQISPARSGWSIRNAVAANEHLIGVNACAAPLRHQFKTFFAFEMRCFDTSS